jgi:2-hydroxy-6-oxonona-2,4-dienedioate hydrolase
MKKVYGMTEAPQRSTAPGERFIDSDFGRLHVREEPGDGPPVLALHGFPDDSRIYKRLAPFVAPRRFVAIDFGGFGHSDRVQYHDLPDQRREKEIGAVLDALGLDRVTLIGHDASGAVAVNYTLANSERIDHLVLLNCYYGNDPVMQLPEMIRLFGDPDFTPLVDHIVEDPKTRAWLLNHTRRQFGYPEVDPDGVAAASTIPQFFGEEGWPDALDAIRAWTRSLYPELRRQDAHIAAGDLAALAVPVTVAFGRDDKYLNATVAAHLASRFPHSTLHLIDHASHWPQWDQPATIADIIRSDAP